MEKGGPCHRFFNPPGTSFPFAVPPLSPETRCKAHGINDFLVSTRSTAFGRCLEVGPSQMPHRLLEKALVACPHERSEGCGLTGDPKTRSQK